jgi:biotin-dependent carboxylase-like uncharacterized protein
VTIEVLRPGLLTTVQDLGRSGWRHLGVGCAGALDAFSHRVANRLVGNRDDAAALEVTLAGPRLRFAAAASVALCGGDFAMEVDGIPVDGWRPLRLPAGATISIGAVRRGARGYLAVAGGFAVAPVLGSASTDLRGGFGGFEGRGLRGGDVLRVAGDGASVAFNRLHAAAWWIDPAPDLEFRAPATIHMLPGRDAAMAAATAFACEWRIAAASDRQGLRLDGAAIAGAAVAVAPSEPVAPGTVQLPPDGRPIVLLADAQTHGGYPRLGHVIRADMPRLAQLRPGDRLRLVPCTVEEARRRACAQRQRLARIGHAIADRLGRDDAGCR